MIYIALAVYNLVLPFLWSLTYLYLAIQVFSSALLRYYYEVKCFLFICYYIVFGVSALVASSQGAFEGLKLLEQYLDIFSSTLGSYRPHFSTWRVVDRDPEIWCILHDCIGNVTLLEKLYVDLTNSLHGRWCVLHRSHCSWWSKLFLYFWV